MQLSDRYIEKLVAKHGASAPENPAPKAPAATFASTVANFCLAGETIAGAVSLAAAHFPHLHREYVAGGCVEPLTVGLDQPGKFTALVSAHQQKQGKTKAEAVSYCVQSFPEAYAAWRASGLTHQI